MKKTNIAVFVSGGGTNLQAIIDAQKNGIILNGEIKLVVSSKPDVFALTRAKNAGINSVVVNKKELGSQEAFEEQLISVLEQHKIEMIVLAGFMSILSQNFTCRYANKIINIHPSLIPSFCGKGFYGLKVHQSALDYGVKVTGATAHYVNEIPDGGQIILQKAVCVEEGDTPETLQKRVMEQAEWIIFPQAVEIVAKNILKSKE
ncbi:MAG: phosphoribosylglycinamide formyltransferase [Clostridia bacterium]|nr:phosphoribosylglycinamide formyltransferase [Clostridia bacterium]